VADAVPALPAGGPAADAMAWLERAELDAIASTWVPAPPATGLNRGEKTWLADYEREWGWMEACEMRSLMRVFLLLAKTQGVSPEQS
jgi:hypothetical protein